MTHSKPFWQEGLNPEQERAVLQTEGPVLILAGAGSGKTKTLTHRIAYLIAEKGISPMNILAVTFTNKAAQEMRERIERLLAKGSEGHFEHTALPQVGTFHNICARILRREITVLGYDQRFQILDDQDQQTLMKKVMKELELDSDQVRPRALLEAISRAKNAFLDEGQFLAQAGSFYEEIVAKAYARYQKELRESNALDFDDLIRFTVKIFQEHPEVLERYQKLFRYIMVDEYQDTNHPQYLLIHLLGKQHQNIFVIGDDYQSIYGWRQADIRNILNFEKDYPEAAVITLDRNYRSTQIILDAADGVISRNRDQRHKKLWTELSGGELVTRVPASDEEAEARFIGETVNRGHKAGKPFRHFAVLYRTNAQSRALEEMFLRLNVQYRIVGGLKFYQRKEIKDMIAYVRLLENPRDFLAIERIINEPKRGVGKVTLEKWYAFARSKELNFLDAAYQLDDTLGIQAGKRQAIKDFADLFFKWQAFRDASGETLASLLRKVADESGYLENLDDGTPEGETRRENVRELFSVAEKFKDASIDQALHSFLEEVALASDTDELNAEADAVQVMTVHSAKGLEFPTVFIIGLEEGIFPHSRSALSPQEMEEERRLMYVALTRAKEKIYLLYTEARTLYGTTQVNPPSRFMDEIPSHLVREEALVSSGFLGGGKKRFGGRSSGFSGQRKTFSFPTPQGGEKKEAVSKAEPLAADAVRPGDMVEHPQFGNGLIVAIDGTLATIAFKRAGVKKMMLGVAPLGKI